MDTTKLLKDVKAYLHITWDDDATDESLSGMISRSMQFFNNKTGKTLDYEEEGQARELLFLRVMYDRSNALDDFRKHYISDINELITTERIKRYDTEKERNQ